MTPLERAARAMATEYGQDPDEIILVEAVGTRGRLARWQCNLPAVRAVIEAIREPSEAMTRAFEAVSPDQWNNPHPNDAWRAGIDALLEEGQPTTATATVTLRGNPDWDKPLY